MYVCSDEVWREVIREGEEIIMDYIIYLALCGFSGVICARADIEVNDWKYWAILGCVIGAYFCGKYA